MAYSDEEIAQVVHEMVRGLQNVLNDPAPAQPWAATGEEARQVVVASVHRARMHWVSPREHHDAWVAALQRQGWRYGPVKDAEAKTHPLLVAYEDLEPGQRLKDELSLAVIAVMASQW